MAIMDPTGTEGDTPTPTTPTPVQYRSFNDIDGQRDSIYGAAIQALQRVRPIANATHRIELADLQYDGDYRPRLKDEKAAVLKQTSLHRPLKGTVRLVSQADNKVLDEQRVTLAHIPHLNSRGLFTRNGVSWALRNQSRLRPGLYTRNRQDGGTETHFNIRPGTGRAFRMTLDPESGLFRFQVEQSQTRAYPVLKSLGVTDEELEEAWGTELLEKNRTRPTKAHNEPLDVAKFVQKLTNRPVDPDLAPSVLQDVLGRAEVDEEVTGMTLGRPVRNLDRSVLMDATRTILKVAKGERRPDNRDSQAFQSIHSAEDLIGERLSRDQAGALRKLLWRAGREGKLGSVPSGILNRNIGSLFEGSGLAQTVEETNPLEIYDARQAITRLGEGGISSAQMVSRDARGVQSSYLGLIDPGRGPESGNLGLDLRATNDVLKGSDNKLYARMLNSRTGQTEIVSAPTLSAKVVGLPGQPEGKRVAAIQDDQLTYVDRDKVDYWLPRPSNLFSRMTQIIPFSESMKGKRLLMGARMTQQALPLANPEAPLVRVLDDDGKPAVTNLSRSVGARYSDRGGVVKSITPDEIVITGPDGQPETIDLYNNHPLARKTTLTNTPSVKVGDVVSPGALVASSNYTDPKGDAAFGKNLRVAYISAEADTLEDAFVISESAARKLTSEHLYKHDLDLDDIHSTKLDDYRAVYGDRYSPEQYQAIDPDGVVREGAVVRPGDPLVLAIGKKGKRAIGAVTETTRSPFTDRTEVWDHENPGVVTDVTRTRDGVRVTVKSYAPMRPADKLSGLYGNKGVVSRVVPDAQMPVDSQGNPVEVIINPYSVVGRHNPNQLAEALLGKVAVKTGKPVDITNFSGKNVAREALRIAEEAGVVSRDQDGNPVDTETLTDPRDGRKIPGVFTGVSYLMRLHHSAEDKLSARGDSGAYTVDGQPAKGGPTGSKRISLMDVNVLTTAGANDFLREAKLIRGQRNDDYWRAVRMGEEPAVPTVHFANEQFRNQLRAAGVRLKEHGQSTQLSPMLDQDVDSLAQHEVESGDTYDFETMEPVAGGLFDITKTGGAEGNRFAKITFPVKIPHPLFEEPIKKVLGLTGPQLDRILMGEEELGGRKGPEAIERALRSLNIDREMDVAKQSIRSGSRSGRDEAVKRLNYLAGFKKLGVNPGDLMISRVPVIPPKYRPVVRARGTDIIHDLNYLYKDLVEARNNYRDSVKAFGSAGEQYQTLRQAVRAVVGTDDPINPKSVEQNLKGILRYAIGVQDTPKAAGFQRKVIGNPVDAVGRGVITADGSLGLDEVGIPREMAFEIFKPLIIRGLTRNGVGAKDAVLAVKNRSPEANRVLERVVGEHPVVFNRAPALHQYAYVGGMAKLHDDNAIRLPYAVLRGLAGDFDGDGINVHAVYTPEAVKNVKETLFPSRNLFHSGTFDTHLEPMQDYVAGLHLATTPDPNGKVVTFDTAEDAKKAYMRGTITARTPIRIRDRSAG